jgi:hypothetical protein
LAANETTAFDVLTSTVVWQQAPFDLDSARILNDDN